MSFLILILWAGQYQDNIRTISGQYQDNIRTISGQYQDNIRTILPILWIEIQASQRDCVHLRTALYVALESPCTTIGV